ncbi:uncharacterized protein LOC129306527 isoform X2 [Prosopis cineraria]|uniref:uncharacterized protein LOC129306527 isoform X2 n=1 Tax=Prosopis cineraria TaxID=364024 RepID=UPI00240EADC6|nr:uncharacterized protein LOC129306527 isoform X2 [Prosopis cineraria]
MSTLWNPVISFQSQLPSFTSTPAKNWSISGGNPWYNFDSLSSIRSEKTQLRYNRCLSMTSSPETSFLGTGKKSKRVWIWTKNKQVMTAAVERGWDTFIFSPQHRHLATDWSSIAVICPLFIGEGEILDGQRNRVATVFDVSTPEELERLRPEDELAENIAVNLLDWQVIPAENIIAAFQSSQKTVFAISNNPSEAQIFLEALEQGLGGIVLKVEDVEPLLQLKVGSFARGLFLVHSECLESNYIASRPFRVNAGPVHAYVAVPGGKTCYLSELKAGKEVIVVNQLGQPRIAIVGRVKIETRQLILVEAKSHSDDQTIYSIFLQNAETVALVGPPEGNTESKTAVPVTSLKVGDEVLLRIQGGARHTGIEIQEFIVEN